MFQQKLIFAAVSNLQNLQSIYRAAESVGRTKDKWMASGKDPYGDFDQDLGKAVDRITSTARRALNQAGTQGMPVAGQYGYAGFLTNMDKATQALEAFGPFPTLDPDASSALAGLKQTLEKARSEFVPIAIPAPQQNVTLPEDKITATPPAPGGAAYTVPGADPGKLSDVVNQLGEKNNPRNWDSFFNPQQ